MKIGIILLAITITLSSILVVIYTQIDESHKTSTYDILLYMHFEYRDSNGQLFAYIQEFNPFIPDMEALNNFLDTAPDQITKNVEKFEVITIQGTIKYDRSTTSSKTTLGDVVEGKYVIYAIADHDGYPIVAGDTLKTTWIAIRPAR